MLMRKRGGLSWTNGHCGDWNGNLLLRHVPPGWQSSMFKNSVPAALRPIEHLILSPEEQAALAVASLQARPKKKDRINIGACEAIAPSHPSPIAECAGRRESCGGKTTTPSRSMNGLVTPRITTVCYVPRALLGRPSTRNPPGCARLGPSSFRPMTTKKHRLDPIKELIAVYETMTLDQLFDARAGIAAETLKLKGEWYSSRRLILAAVVLRYVARNWTTRPCGLLSSLGPCGFCVTFTKGEPSGIRAKRRNRSLVQE